MNSVEWNRARLLLSLRLSFLLLPRLLADVKRLPLGDRESWVARGLREGDNECCTMDGAKHVFKNLIFLPLFLALSAQAHSIDQKIEGALESPYTAKIIELILGWGEIDFPPAPETGEPFWIEGIRTKGNSNYIGLRKRIFIHASPVQVLAILEDFSSYPDVFPGVQKVKSLSQDGNETTTSWVRDRPLFFVPKVKYEQTYVSQEIGERSFLRYQLRSGNTVSHSDGVIVVEAVTGGTYVTSYDFFEGNFGLAKFFAENKIWEDTFKGFERADFALKMKAENPDWSPKQIESQADSLLARYPVHLESVHFLGSQAP